MKQLLAKSASSPSCRATFESSIQLAARPDVMNVMNIEELWGRLSLLIVRRADKMTAAGLIGR